jgi:hypothetical protein
LNLKCGFRFQAFCFQILLCRCYDESLSLSKTVRQSHARAVTATHDVHHDRADEDEAADAAEAAAAADAADTESPGARLKPPQRSVKNRLLPGLKSHGTVTKKRGLLQQKEAVTKDALKQKNGGKAKGQAAQVHVVPADNQQQRVVDYLTRTGRMRGHAKLSDVVQCRYAASDPRVHQPRYRCVVTYANLEECVLLQEEAVEDECPEAKAVVGRWCAGKREAKEDALGGLLGWLTAEDEKNGCADE